MEQREAGTETSGFHTTNPFGSGIDAVTELNRANEGRVDTTIAAMFSEIMSDYVPSQEQNVEIAAATSQPNSSRASPDSTNQVDGTEITMQSNTWPALEVTDYSLENWPNSNHGPTCEPSTAHSTIEQISNLVTPKAAQRTPASWRDPSGSQALTRSIGENPFLSGYTQPGAPAKASSKPAENPTAPVEENPLRYTFRTQSAADPNIDYTNADRLFHTPSSRASAVTAPDSTVTWARKEVQAIREDFRSSLAQLAQVQTKLARENSEHGMRADLIMRDMDEMRKGLLEIQAEGRQNQGRLEASMASLNDLIKQRETARPTSAWIYWRIRCSAETWTPTFAWRT